MNTWKWHRKKDGFPELENYEVSSKGDKRFSAFYAKTRTGRSIEEVYQVDVKGYNSIKEGKGKNPKDGDRVRAWNEYLYLWRRWAKDHPDLIEDLREKSRGKVLTDMFANSHINQAHALAIILTETDGE